MEGSTVAALALSKGLVAVDGASVHGETAVAPNGAAACSGSVAAHGAVDDGGRAFVHDGTTTLTTLAVGDAASRNVERGTADVHNGAAVVALAVVDGDIGERCRALVDDAAGGVGAVVSAVPAAADGAVRKGKVASLSHDDDTAFAGGTGEAAG